MTRILVLLASLPGLCICFYIYLADSHEREPRLPLLLSFALGAASTVWAYGAEMFGQSFGCFAGDNIITSAALAFGVIAVSEEIPKYVVLRWYSYANKAFSEPLDGIVYSVMIGMGFATAENLHYGWEYGASTLWVRAFTAVPAHATFAVAMGYFVGKAKFADTVGQKVYFLTCGLGLAILLHGTYDFFLIQHLFLGSGIGALLSLWLGITLSRRMIGELEQRSRYTNGKWQ